MIKLPDLTRTKAAIEAYDAADAALGEWDDLPIEKWLLKIQELDRLGEAVGAAFGEETKDRNDPEACRKAIRPGSKVPGPGQELSFVRRVVATWEEQQ